MTEYGKVGITVWHTLYGGAQNHLSMSPPVGPTYTFSKSMHNCYVIYSEAVPILYTTEHSRFIDINKTVLAFDRRSDSE